MPGRPPKPLALPERAAVIVALERGASLSRAAELAGVTPERLYALRDHDPLLASDLETAFERSADLLEDEAWHRAVEAESGRKSDRLLEMLLKAKRPWRYSDRRTVQHTGLNGGPIQAAVAVAHIDVQGALEVLAEQGIIVPGQALPAIER